MTKEATHRTIHILTGPTAVGKTELALRWAEKHSAEIVSCDSLLFYRGMDIGTAKPTKVEQARVPHHLMDILDVAERMDVAQFVLLARAAVEAIAARGRAVLVVGGSGLYLKAFLAPVADEVDVPAEVRARVEKLPLAEAVKELQCLNPQGLEKLDAANPRRVARALERCLASGKTLGELKKEFAQQRAPFDGWRVLLTRLDRPPGELAGRIEARVAAMLRAGLVDEVRRLRAAGLEKNPSAVRAIGYREVLAMLEGKLGEMAQGPEPAEGLADEIAKNTRALVKKQRTWFRTQLPEHKVVSLDEVPVSELFDQ
jgi:tRNA dimethylallyltransferase